MVSPGLLLSALFIWASESLRAEARGRLLTILHEQSRLIKRQ
jgi:hypothetical protein